MIQASRVPQLAGRTLIYLVLIVFGALMVLPFYWMIVTSLQTPENLVSFPPKWWPQPPVTLHYRDAIAQAPFLLYYRNSLIVAVVSVGCSILFGLFAGYAFDRVAPDLFDGSYFAHGPIPGVAYVGM